MMLCYDSLCLDDELLELIVGRQRNETEAVIKELYMQQAVI